MTAAGQVWDVDRIASITDGDTLRVHRSRVTQLGDDWYRITDVNAAGTPRSVPIRLAWVDTPERGAEDWNAARYDLMAWVQHLAPKPLRVVCYESAGWDRILADLTDADGNSASQWMMRDRGWPPYVGAKA